MNIKSTKRKRKIHLSFRRLLGLISLLLGFMGFISPESLQAAQFKLIKEERIAVTPTTTVHFLGKPQLLALGQGRFAPVVYREVGKPPVVRVDGVDIPLQNIPEKAEIIHYDSQTQGVGYIQRKVLVEEVGQGTFTWQTIGGQVLWQVTHIFMGEVRVSAETGTVFILRQDQINYSPNSAGMYVYNLSTGRSLFTFESPSTERQLAIDNYVFSGDNKRLFFEYATSGPITEESMIDPKVQLACVNANGQLLWDVVLKRLHGLSVSYHGDRVLYMTGPPHSKLEEKLGRKLYQKVGLIDGSGNILWEVDNPSRTQVDLFPGGDYYYASLGADQLGISDPTIWKKPVYHCLFESLTHRAVWRKDLETLVPQLKASWYRRSPRMVSLDNRWDVSVFSSYPKGASLKKDGEPVRSLLVLTNLITREILAQQGLTGEVDNALTPVDLKVIELFFVDGHRMLFEVVP